MGVALRKESVDRNRNMLSRIQTFLVSLSARRAWIEIVRGCLFCVKLLVALRKESVDRNVNLRVVDGSKSCRSPQGERG